MVDFTRIQVPSLLIRTIGDQGVGDVVPGLQHRLSIAYRRFLLARFAEFQRRGEPPALENRQRDAGSGRVLQRTRHEQLVESEGIEHCRPGQLDRRIKVRHRDPDIGGLRVQIVLGLPDVRASARELERNADRDVRGRRRHRPRASEFATQAVRRQIQQQAQGVDLLRLLLLEARDLRAYRFDLRLGVLDVEPRRQALFLQRLRQLEETLFGLHVFVGDVHERLRAAQLYVVVRDLRQRRDQYLPSLILGGLDLRVGGLDLAADAAPQIQFPRGVEPGGVFVDRRDRGQGADAPR